MSRRKPAHRSTRRATSERAAWRSPCPARASSSRGFTLIEIMVALAILALLATFAWRATASLVDGEMQLAGESRRWQTLDALFARIEGDVGAAVPRGVRVPGGREPPWVGSIGADGQASFVFTRAGSDPAEAGAEGSRLGYRLSGGAVEIAYWPHLDRVAGVEPVRYALADGVLRMEVRYADDDGEWTDRWPPPQKEGLPAAMAIALTLAEGGRIERILVLR